LLHIALNIRVAISQSYSPAAVLLLWLLNEERHVHFSSIGPLARMWRQHAAAMQRLQQHVNEPGVLRLLLQTAVLRGNSAAAGWLCRMPASSQLSVDDAIGLLDCVLGTGGSSSIDMLMLRALCSHLPAAQQLPVSYVAGRILQLVRKPACDPTQKSIRNDALRILAVLPAAQQIPEQTAVQMLKLSLLHQLSFHELLQPVQQLSVETVRSIMFEALDWHRWVMSSWFQQ
jgi:hypothetical protein